MRILWARSHDPSIPGEVVPRAGSTRTRGITTTSMYIGELARAVGTSTKTIRYYESLGLMGPARRTESGYRVYSDEDASRLRFILGAKGLGLSLAQLQEVVGVWDRGGDVCHEVGSFIEEKLAELDARIEELRSYRDRLRTYKRAMDRQGKSAGVVCRHVHGVQEGKWDPSQVSPPGPGDWDTPGEASPRSRKRSKSVKAAKTARAAKAGTCHGSSCDHEE